MPPTENTKKTAPGEERGVVRPMGAPKTPRAQKNANVQHLLMGAEWSGVDEFLASPGSGAQVGQRHKLTHASAAPGAPLEDFPALPDLSEAGRAKAAARLATGDDHSAYVLRSMCPHLCWQRRMCRC